MAEWFDGVDRGAGNGMPVIVAFNGADWDLVATIDVSAWASGDHVLPVRAWDAAGNWSAVDTTLLCVVQCDDIFADSFETGDVSAWASATGGSRSFWIAAPPLLWIALTSSRLRSCRISRWPPACRQSGESCCGRSPGRTPARQ
jgi:hypothetical protein